MINAPLLGQTMESQIFCFILNFAFQAMLVDLSRGGFPFSQLLFPLLLALSPIFLIKKYRIKLPPFPLSLQI